MSISTQPIPKHAVQSSLPNASRTLVDVEKKGAAISALELRPPDNTDPFLVTLDEGEKPTSLKTSRKWAAVVVISTGGLCVATASSMVSSFRLFSLCNQVMK